MQKLNCVDKFYWLFKPDSGPLTPSHWSFSALSLWRSCPRQWWLKRAQYSHLDSDYFPDTISPAAFQGQVIHKLLEEFSKHQGSGYENLNQAFKEFKLRPTTIQVTEELLQQYDENPRVNAQQLRSGLSIDSFMNLFKKLGRTHFSSSVKASAIYSRNKPSVTIRNGAEVWLKIDSPPIHGVLDILHDGHIVDLKTGVEKDDDREQIRFYALIYWIFSGNRPESLKLFYTKTSEYQFIDVPTESELETQRESIQQEITSVNEDIESDSIGAKPAEEKCRWCSVRQLCGSYWSSVETELLRSKGLEESIRDGQSDSFICDINVEALPASWSLGFPCIGTAFAQDLGEVHVNINTDRCPKISDKRPTSARILKAIVRVEEGKWVVGMGKMTEVFWVSGKSSQLVDSGA